MTKLETRLPRKFPSIYEILTEGDFDLGTKELDFLPCRDVAIRTAPHEVQKSVEHGAIARGAVAEAKATCVFRDVKQTVKVIHLYNHLIITLN